MYKYIGGWQIAGVKTDFQVRVTAIGSTEPVELAKDENKLQTTRVTFVLDTMRLTVEHWKGTHCDIWKSNVYFMFAALKMTDEMYNDA